MSALPILAKLVDESLDVTIRVTYPDVGRAKLGVSKKIQLVVKHKSDPLKTYAVLAPTLWDAIWKTERERTMIGVKDNMPIGHEEPWVEIERLKGEVRQLESENGRLKAEAKKFKIVSATLSVDFLRRLDWLKQSVESCF